MSEFGVGVVVGVVCTISVSAIIGAWLVASMCETGDFEDEE